MELARLVIRLLTVVVIGLVVGYVAEKAADMFALHVASDVCGPEGVDYVRTEGLGADVECVASETYENDEVLTKLTDEQIRQLSESSR